MGFHHLVNTAYFSEAANDFRKNGGRYTTAPIGSRDYQQYWEEQERRCQQGYKVGDLWIPGRHYHYLNFTPIMKADDKIAIKAFEERRNAKTKKVSALIADRILDFPRFYEIDYEWFNFKHIAWFGGEFMGVKSPGGKGMVCGKTRGAGFSYKEAAKGVYNYTFIPGSKSYYFAGIEEYLIRDGILNKVQSMLDFTNTHIHEWKQNRQKKNTLMHQRASYVDSFGTEQGSMSEIIGIIVDDPDKVRGKRGRDITFEEGGSFKNVKKALGISHGSIKDGDIYVGQQSLFGTGGEEGDDIEGLQDVFDDPASFNMLEFPNIWEDGYEGTSCGYFVPVWRSKGTFMDADGNCDIEGAIQSELEMREQKKKAKDPKVLDSWKAEYPFKPAEMFNRWRKGMFDTAECLAQIKRIESGTTGVNLRYGKFIQDEEKGTVFINMNKEDARPIERYPHNREDNLEGCVVIAARPYLDKNGHTPSGLYQIVFDPYYKEESEDITSLFCIQVWKQYNQIDPIDEGLKVAWWVGRPQQLETAYRILFQFADFYNSTVQGEVAGGGQGVIDYAKANKLLHLIEYEPLMMHNKEFASSQMLKNRSLLMNMPTEKKRMGLTYLANWHTNTRGFSPDGKPILNIHREYDVAFLKEMAKHDGEKNADRISTGIIAQFMLKENAYKEETRHVEKNDFYSRQLFNSDGGRASYTARNTSFHG